MMEDLLLSCLCSSFPVDFLLKHLEHDVKYPGKFNRSYLETYEHMYDQQQKLLLQAEREQNKNLFGTGAPHEFPRFLPAQYPNYQRKQMPRKVKKKDANDDTNLDIYSDTSSKSSKSQSSNASVTIKTANEKKKRIKSPAIHYDKSCWVIDPKSCRGAKTKFFSALAKEDVHCNTRHLRPKVQSNAEKLYFDQISTVVDSAIDKSAKFITGRMNSLLAQLKGLTVVIKLMCTCEQLRLQAIEFRFSIYCKAPIEKGRVSCFLFEHMTYPYLFLTTIKTLFELYPQSMSGSPWNCRNPADARRIVNLVLYRRLRGNEILTFLVNLSKYMCQYIVSFGCEHLKLSPELSQYYMYYAFAVDSSELFYFVSQSSNPFSVDCFDWMMTLNEISQHKLKFYRYFIPLVTCHLKNKLNMTEDQYATKSSPFNDNIFSSEFLKEFNRFFKDFDNKKLRTILKWWEYEITQMKLTYPPLQNPYEGVWKDLLLCAEKSPKKPLTNLSTKNL